MEVRKLNNSPYGIERIFTSNRKDLYTKLTFRPKKEPYIVFELPYFNESLKYVRTTTLSRFGKINFNYKDEYNNQKVALTVTGDRKIRRVINIFLKHSLYPKDKNLSLHEHLIALKKECKKREEKKPPLPFPLKCKSYSTLKILHQLGTNSTNNIYLVEKTNKPGQKKYVFKENISGRPITKYEAYNSWCYRLLLNDRHPKATVVYGEKGEIKGLLIDYIEGFESFYDRYNKFFKTANDLDRPTVKELLDSKIIQPWASGYLHYEWDGHGHNYGYRPDGLSVKLDDDQSNISVTWKYTDDTSTAPTASFTRTDIESFPLVSDRETRNSPVNNTDKLITRRMILRLRNQKQFMDDMYYIFLKYILIPEEVYEAVGKATIGVPKQMEPIVNLSTSSTKKFKKIILKIPAFCDYVKDNKNIINNILEDFKKYNNDFKKPDDHYLHINLDTIEKNFNDVLEYISKNPKNPKNPKEPEAKTTASPLPSPPESLPIKHIQKKGLLRRHPIAGGILIGAISAIVIAGLTAGIVFSGGLFSVPLLAPVASFLAPAAATLTVLAKTVVLGIAAKITSVATGTLITTAAVALKTPIVGAVAGALGASLAFVASGLGGLAGFITKKILHRKHTPSHNKTNQVITKIPSTSHSLHLKLAGSKESPPNQLPSVFDPALNEAKKTCRELKKSTALKLYSHHLTKTTQKDLDEVMEIIEFIATHHKFFIAPLQDQNKFRAWIEKEPQNLDQLFIQEEAQALSKDLLKVLENKEPQKLKNKKRQKEMNASEYLVEHDRELYAIEHNKALLPEFMYYQEALLGEVTIHAGTRPVPGLIHGNIEPMKELLLKNPKLRQVFLKHLHNTAIGAWEYEHKIKPGTLKLKEGASLNDKLSCKRCFC